MEPKSIQITPPEGYKIDKENSTFEKIVFKPIDSRPRSWKEYLKMNPGATITRVPSEEYVSAFLAMMQLISLRQAWIGEWEPDWNNCVSDKWKIVYSFDDFLVCNHTTLSGPLSFPTKEIAQEFLGCFKDLIEQAKPLL